MLSLRFVGRGARMAVSLTLGVAGCGDDDGTGEPPVEATAPEAEPEPEPEPEPPPEPELDVDGEPRYGTIPLAPGFSPDPHEERGTSRGVLPATELAEDCAGFVTEAPLHVIEARGPFARMHLMALGEVPVGLVLRTEEGEVTCAPIPDGEGEPAHLTQHLAPGAHRLWVSTAEAEDAVRYTLGLSEIELTADALTPP
jgi:hypothetical protein